MLSTSPVDLTFLTSWQRVFLLQRLNKLWYCITLHAAATDLITITLFRSVHFPLCCSSRSSKLSAPYSSIFLQGFVCVSQSHPVLSFTPKNQKYSLFHPALHTPISLRLHQALIRPCSHAGKMTERGRREWRGREERREKRWQLLNKCGASGKRGKKEKSAMLMMSFSPWEEEEICAALRGAGAGLKLAHTHALSFYTHMHTHITGLTTLCLPSIWIVDCLCCHLPYLTQMLTCNTSSNNQS